MTRRRVVIVTLHADPSTPAGVHEGGGTHKYVAELMSALPKNGWLVTVLTRRTSDSQGEREEVSADVELFRLTIGSLAPVDKRVLNDLHNSSLSAARSVLAARRDIALIHSVYWNSGRLAADLSRELTVPFVHTVISNGCRRLAEGLVDQPKARVEVETRVFCTASCVLCVSEEERADVIEFYGVDPQRALSVGRPVSPRFLAPCRDELGNPQQLTAGGSRRW